MSSFKSFRNYARSPRAADVVGDEFAAYAKGDPYFPDVKAWGELRTYLNGRGAPHEIFVVARVVWKDYRRHLKIR
jgi:hypothetical protein